MEAKKNELMNELTELDHILHGVLDDLKKARHTSNTVSSFYDLRSDEAQEQAWDEKDIAMILCGYNGAATEHDIIHDYLLTTISKVQKVVVSVELLRERLKHSELQDVTGKQNTGSISASVHGGSLHKIILS